MFLKSLTLKGFKSFADTTTLEFEPGVTVVVGPNGSGKSNIVDAVAWVLGAQGPRTVRSAKMDDVIFAGSAKRSALGRAEVTLTIDNSAGLLPVDFTEVTITRTLFRNGDSEYALNGVPCRLLDVQELLSDTGVGRQQHVIVSQGQLDAVLNARPEDRRAIVEEAAGVLKFRRRREKAQRRLEATETSLVRLQDLLREVRRQLRPLERQAEAARRHGDLAGELSALRRHLAGRELVAIEGRLARAAGGRGELDRAETELRAALGRFDTDVVLAEREVAALDEQHRDADLGEALSRAEGLRQRARGLCALVSERRRSVAHDLAASADAGVIASLEADAARLAADLSAVEVEGAGLEPLAAELAGAEEALAMEAAKVEAEWGGGAVVVEHDGAAAEVRGELGALRSSAEAARSQLHRLESRLASLEEKASSLAAEASRLRGEIGAAEAAEAALVATTDQAAGLKAQVASDLAVAESALRQAETEFQRWSTRVEALSMALDEARARAGAERLAEVSGVIGTLLELVEIDAGWEYAFEAAAGEAVAAVVVDGTDAARAALQSLRQRDLTGAVLALPDPDAAPVPAPLAFAGEAVRHHVRAQLPGVEHLLDRLLARAVAVAGGIGEAVMVATGAPDLVVVTLAGDRLGPSAWRAGGSGTGVTGAALDEARRQATEVEERVAGLRHRVTEQRRRLERAEAAEADAAARLDDNDGRLSAAADALQRAESDRRDAVTETEAQAAHRTEVADRLAHDDRRIAELESLLPGLEHEAAAEAQRRLAERSARARLADRTAAVEALRRDLQLRAVGLDERRSLLTRRLAEVEQRLERDVARRAEATARRRELEQMGGVLDRLVDLTDRRRAELDALTDRVRRARQGETAEARARTEHLEQLRRQRASAERSLAEVRERRSRVDLDEAEAKVRLEALVETVRRDLDCEPESTRESPCPDLPPGSSPQTRVRELERELRLLGPINPLALEEYDALQERHRFLEAQLEDVRAGRRELAKVIRAIDAEIVEVFRAAWADVALHFERLFATLFPGGQGRLRLTDPDHLLETGIEVEARPSGKNVKRLSLLSGGERSLTAMAFLFAVFRSRPSPFYLMDEVEAALDDVNLHRFLDLVHEFRDEAQLLIVSHQKRTMEAADCLYGVTMAPGGSSRVVSERISAGA